MGSLTFSKGSLYLNEEQFQAATRPSECNQRILAAAGSGKTTTLTARIAWLIEQAQVRPNSIVLMTFSRNAAHQMLQRLEHLIGKTSIWAGTFHGLSRTLLSQFQPDALQGLQFIDELVTLGKSWLMTPAGRKWVSKLRYVVVDEFQDSNANQWNMIQRMLHPGARLIVVGDDCQNIQTWRGSDVRYILDLHTMVRDLVDDQLRCNYRSSSSIIRVANSVMKHIPTLPWKGTMIAQRPPTQKPTVRFFHRAIDECAWILQEIRTLKKEQPSKSIAILSRNNSDLYRIEEELLNHGIRCRLRDLGIDETTGDEGVAIDLITFHASKGLEWDHVFLIHMNDGVFPSTKKSADAIICERRLFQVGVTRAKERLSFSQTRDERDLSRFIREIPQDFLLYHGLAKQCLSDIELGEGQQRVSDLLKCLDGDEIKALRDEGHLGWTERSACTVESLYPAGMIWKLPSWAHGEFAGDFQRFLQIWTKRMLCQLCGIPFRDTEAEQLIFTLRIFAEDLEFWTQWKSQIRQIMDTFYSGEEATRTPPPLDYGTLQHWSLQNGIHWTPKDLVCATSIIGKLRGQLRPLRFDSQDISEFRIAPARQVVPIQWRAEVLRSWRRVIDLDVSWDECLMDLWRIGAMPLVAEGRNAALYRAADRQTFLESEEMQQFLQSLESHLAAWVAKEEVHAIHEWVEDGMGFLETMDVRTRDTVWQIGSQDREKVDTHELLRLAVTSSFLPESVTIQSIGVLLPLEGKILRCKLPLSWRTSAAAIMSRAQQKKDSA